VVGGKVVVVVVVDVDVVILLAAIIWNIDVKTFGIDAKTIRCTCLRDAKRKLGIDFIV
jgi:hypothetical protein